MGQLSKTALQDRMDAWASVISGTWTVHLFKNNLTPTPDNVVGDFTESTFTGYASQALAALGADTYLVGPAYTWQKAAGTYTFNGSGATNENVYGYYVTNGAGVLQFSHRFTGAPLLCGAAGTSIQITLTIQDLNAFAS